MIEAKQKRESVKRSVSYTHLDVYKRQMMQGLVLDEIIDALTAEHPAKLLAAEGMAGGGRDKTKSPFPR